MERLLVCCHSPESIVDNLIAIRKFEHQYSIAKHGKPIDRTEWGMPPQMVNAYYNPQMNEIVFRRPSFNRRSSI